MFKIEARSDDEYVGRVCIDPVTHQDVFPAVISNYRWNGWACPTFDLETARRVVDWVNRTNDGYTRFFWVEDRQGLQCLIQLDTDGGDWEEDEVYTSFVGDENSGFSIGGWSWTWSDLEEDAPTDPEGLDLWLNQQSEHAKEYCEVWNTALRGAYDSGATAQEACATAQAAVDAHFKAAV